MHKKKKIPAEGLQSAAAAPHLAMKTATTLVFRLIFFSASWMKNSVTKATCPRQSVVPRPYSLSPSRVRVNGSRSHVSGLAGTTSKWLPTNETMPCTGGERERKRESWGRGGGGQKDDELRVNLQQRKWQSTTDLEKCDALSQGNCNFYKFSMR